MSDNCYKCSAELQIESTANIMRSEECPKCYANIRCCMMCSFYDSKSYNECREPTADRIVDKEKANFCDFYKFGNQNEQANATKDALAMADALFKK